MPCIPCRHSPLKIPTHIQNWLIEIGLVWLQQFRSAMKLLSCFKNHSFNPELYLFEHFAIKTSFQLFQDFPKLNGHLEFFKKVRSSKLIKTQNIILLEMWFHLEGSFSWLNCAFKYSICFFIILFLALNCILIILMNFASLIASTVQVWNWVL